MRSILAALPASAALAVNPNVNAGLDVSSHVDLDQPGARARVQRDNPAHFRAITRILREAPQRPPQTLAGCARTAFDARMASALLIKASYPPQARLEFVLDDTEYRAMVTLRNTEPSISPAKQR